MKKNFTNHETYHFIGIYAPKNHILQFLKNPPLEKSLPPKLAENPSKWDKSPLLATLNTNLCFDVVSEKGEPTFSSKIKMIFFTS